MSLHMLIASIAPCELAHEQGTRERFSEIAALVAAHHAEPRAPRWPALLLVAFEPMLRWMRRRFARVAGSIQGDDLDQIVVVAFLEAIRAPHVLRAGRFAAAAIEWATRRGVKSALGARACEIELEDEPAAKEDVTGARASLACAELARLVHAEAGPELADAFLATTLLGESMREYVDRVHGALPADRRARICEGLLRRRARLLPKLQDRLAD